MGPVMLLRGLLACCLLGLTFGCESDVCFGDSCSCYGDPQAADANAGCAKCMPDVVCEQLARRVEECGIALHGDLSTCESRVSAHHSCIETAHTLACDLIAIACPAGDMACLAELITSGMTSCNQAIASGAIVDCPTGRCLHGECIDCLDGTDWSCPAPQLCNPFQKCVTACETDAACGPLSSCFANECDPPLGTPCTGLLDCGSSQCRAANGDGQPVCTKSCMPSCELGSFCACPAGFSCLDGFCAK
jgi:hypothetical protein